MGGDARDAPSGARWPATVRSRRRRVIFALLADEFRARNVSCVDRCGQIYLAATSRLGVTARLNGPSWTKTTAKREGYRRGDGL